MKSIILLCMLSISFLPLAISGLPPLIRLPTKADFPGNPAVLDVDGNPVIFGVKYYAVPASTGDEGAVTVDNPIQGSPSTCPTAVVLNISIILNMSTSASPSLVKGRPIIFYPLRIDAGAVKESLPLNVAFYESDPSDPCANKNVWKLDVAADRQLIVTGGEIGNEDDIINWFRIEKNVNRRGYVFTFWPSLCFYCDINYWRIGVAGENYQLGIINDFPYPFNLVRAE